MEKRYLKMSNDKNCNTCAPPLNVGLLAYIDPMQAIDFYDQVILDCYDNPHFVFGYTCDLCRECFVSFIVEEKISILYVDDSIGFKEMNEVAEQFNCKVFTHCFD